MIENETQSEVVLSQKHIQGKGIGLTTTFPYPLKKIILKTFAVDVVRSLSNSKLPYRVP